MDAVNQTLAQLRGLFASMTPGARVTAGLLLTVVVVSVGFLFQKATAGPDEYLFGAEVFPSSTIRRMEAAMAQADVTGFQIEGNRIRVPRAQKSKAVAAIASAGELPADFHGLMKEGIDGGSMFDFRDQKNQRIRAAREAQVSLVLSEYPWVEQARVIINQREEPGLSRSRHATAAVSLRPAVGEELTTKRLREVQRYVAMSCDVPTENIAITDLSGGAGYAGGDDIDPDDFDHPLYKLKTKYERKLRSDIIRQLSFIDGLRVAVNAQLDDTQQRRVVQIKPEQEGVEISKQQVEELDSQTTGPAGAPVGVTANGPTPNARDESFAVTNRSEKSRNATDSASVVGSSKTETVTLGMVVKEAEASVAIPMSHVTNVYKKENRGPDGADPETIDPNDLQLLQDTIKSRVETIVQPMLPKLALGENEFKQVKVEFFYDLEQPEIPAPSATAGALAWTSQNANALGLTALAVVSLVMLRSLVKSGGSSDDPVGGFPSLRLDGEAGGEAGSGAGASDDEEDEAADRPRLKLRRADSLKDDLSDMVSNDPDAAAAILRNWINNAG